MVLVTGGRDGERGVLVLWVWQVTEHGTHCPMSWLSRVVMQGSHPCGSKATHPSFAARVSAADEGGLPLTRLAQCIYPSPLLSLALLLLLPQC